MTVRRINVLYSIFGVLKFDNMIDMEHVKLLFRFSYCYPNISKITMLN